MQPGELLTIRQAADVFGISYETMRRMVQGNEIASVRIHRRSRVPRSAIAVYCEKHFVGPGGESAVSEKPAEPAARSLYERPRSAAQGRVEADAVRSRFGLKRRPTETIVTTE